MKAILFNITFKTQYIIICYILFVLSEISIYFSPLNLGDIHALTPSFSPL